MGSQSVTCHPAEVTFPPLPQPKLVLDLANLERCKAELTVPHSIRMPVYYCILYVKDVCVQLTMWHCPHSPATTAAAIDQYLLPVRPTAANLVNLQQHCVTARWGRQTLTDRRMPDSCTDPALHTMQAVPIVKVVGKQQK